MEVDREVVGIICSIGNENWSLNLTPDDIELDLEKDLGFSRRQKLNFIEFNEIVFDEIFNNDEIVLIHRMIDIALLMEIGRPISH